MMSSLFSRLCVAAVASLAVLAPLAVVAGDHTCSNGRLFLSDSANAQVWVYDLDAASGAPTQVGSALASAAPGMTLYSTGTATARVAALFGGNNATDFVGKVQFFRSGITTDNHGDHLDIVKNAPGRYSYEMSGYKPAHFTASAGFMAVFFDGVWVQGGSSVGAVQPSAAMFVPESAFTEDSLTVTPAVTSISLPGGSHHGVAYALATDAFIVSQATEERANYTSTASTPNGFAVYNAAGAITTDLNDRSNNDRNCSSAHGAAHLGDVFVFGCSSAGILRVAYDATLPAGTRVSSSKLAYPAPVAGKSFRSSTIYAQDTNGLFVANFNDAGTPSTLVPSYTLSFPPTAGAPALSTSQLIQTNSTTARFCAYAVDQGTPETAGVSIVAYLATDGKLYASAVQASGALVAGSTTVSVQVAPSSISCASYGLVAGFGSMFVFNKLDGTLYTVSMKGLLEGQSAAAVSSITLPFLPASGAVSVPHGMDCGAAAHNHGSGSSTGMAGAATTHSPVTVVLAIAGAAAMWLAGRS